jgi:hypothetical protein
LNGLNCGQPCAELLRLDLSVPPTAPENQSRLGSALSTDKAGYPNGRRPDDDVTDITVRVVGGNNYIANHIGDGVNFLAGAPEVVGVDITANGIARNFPFLPTPYDGKCSAGQGANPCNPRGGRVNHEHRFPAISAAGCEHRRSRLPASSILAEEIAPTSATVSPRAARRIRVARSDSPRMRISGLL